MIDGETGFLLEPDNPDTWVATLMGYLGNPEIRVNQSKAAQTYAQQFSWKDTAGCIYNHEART